MHNANKIALGTVKTSVHTVTCEAGDPATFRAGIAVRRASTGDLQIENDDTAALIGISLGRDLSDARKTSVCRKGLGVPLRLRDQPYASGVIEITAFANLVSGTADTIEVAGVEFTAQAGAATPGDATFQAATNDNDTAASLAAQINAHAAASLLVVATVDGAEVTVTALEAGDGGNALTLVYTDNDTNVGATVTGDGTLEGGELGLDELVLGATVYVDEQTGEAVDADDDAAVATSAVYASGILEGVDVNGSVAQVALVDMPGGL